MSKIIYWSPHFSNVATINNVINSAYSLKKYGQDAFSVKIIDAIGEWKNFKEKLLYKRIDYLKLGPIDLSRYLPITGFFYSRFLSLLVILYGILPLKNLLKKEKPNFFIIHLLTSLPLLITTLFNLDTKIILRISGLPKLNFIRKFFWRIVSKNIFLVTCASDETKIAITKLGIFSENKIITLCDPIINVSYFNKKKKVELDKNLQNKNYFLSIGRLTRQKNQQLLVNLFSILKKENKNFNLYIIGDGEKKIFLNNLIKKLNLSENVFLLGHKENVFPYIKSAKAIFSSSLWEDPGAVMIEAAFCNTLVISSDCMSGPKEFLENGKAGYLFENNNIKSLKNSLDKFFNENLDKKKEKKIFAKKNSKKYTIFSHYLALKKIIN
tara:strand:+ start:2197 stop:3342 length:1146 start_codon:yes stop_codon:yes gene_type:complete